MGFFVCLVGGFFWFCGLFVFFCCCFCLFVFWGEKGSRMGRTLTIDTRNGSFNFQETFKLSYYSVSTEPEGKLLHSLRDACVA